MASVVTDTHAALWHLLHPASLSPAARTSFNSAVSAGDPIYLPSIVLVEVRYLVEKGKLPGTALERLNRELDFPDSAFVLAPLDLRVARTLGQVVRDSVPDMPDRIIAATALSLNLPLVTRDRKIQAAGIQTIW